MDKITKKTKKSGRKSKFSSKILKKAEKYIQSCVDTPVMEGKKQKIKVNIPTIEGLAYELGYHRDTIYEWADRYPRFSDILEKLREIQASRLINESLGGNYTPIIAKLLLAKHGYRDMSSADVDITTKGEKINSFSKLTDEQLENFAKRGKN
jgi:hypothetical protein